MFAVPFAPVLTTYETYLQIAANITCYVHPGSRANAAKPSRLTRHVAERIDAIERAALETGGDPREAVLRMARDEYDDWIEYRSRAPRFCSDLDSAEVSRMLGEGLVLGAAEKDPGALVLVSRSGELEAREERKSEEGRKEGVKADGVSDVSQAGELEAHARGDGDLELGGVEMRSTGSTQEVAEAARLLVDGPGASWEEPDNAARQKGGGNTEQDEISMPVPRWTTLPEPDDEAA